MAFTCNIEGVGSTNKETWLLIALDLPVSREALSLLRPVFDLDDEVALLLGSHSLIDSAFTLRR